MGVDQVSVQPVVLVVRGALQLADGDDRVGQVTFTVLVAVDLQHVRELVEATDLLHLLERLGDDGRVDKAHTRDGVGLGSQFLTGQLGGRVIGLYLGVRDVVRLACAVDVALDVRALVALLVRIDLESLNDLGVGHTDEHGRQQQQPEAGHRDHDVLEVDVGEEQNRTDDRDDGEDHQGGLDRVHIRVGSTEGVAAIGKDQAVTVQPVGARTQEHEQAQEHGQVHPCGGGGALSGVVLQAYPAVQVVHDHRGDERQDHGHVHVAEQGLDERQCEREEADVHTELGVVGPEVLSVHELQVDLPVTTRSGSGQQGQDADDEPEEQLAVRVDGLPVAIQPLLFQAHRSNHRFGPVGEENAGADDDGHHQRRDGEQQDPCPQLGQEDRGEADGVEPHVVGDKVCGERQSHDDDDHGRRDWREQP